MIIATFLIKAIITIIFVSFFVLSLALLTYSIKLLLKAVKKKGV